MNTEEETISTEKFQAWPSIESFSSIRKNLKKYSFLMGGKRSFVYKAKVKLHGTNAGVRITPDGEVKAQSRERVISPLSDNMGFAAYVANTMNSWKSLKGSRNLLFFGEWVGPGVMKGTACSKIPQKSFGIFGVIDLESKKAIFEPSRIAQVLGEVSIPGAFVIPWYESGREFLVEWDAESELLESGVAEEINQCVLQVEKCDPLVKDLFGIEGVGEGLVFYPQGEGEGDSLETFSTVGFKAKGEEHRVVAQKVAVSVDPATAESVEGFCKMVLTLARLEQGLQAVGEEKKLTGAFIKWVVDDVAKECQNELQESGLSFESVVKPLSVLARVWFLSKC